MSSARPRVLLVSKPVAPPWNDSSKNLVRDLVEGLTRVTPVVFGREGDTPPAPHAEMEHVYAPLAGGYAPPMRDNLRVLVRLATGRGVPLWHFFFAPNPRTSGAARVARSLRRARTVQTVCSMPRADLDVGRVTFADRTIVLSEAAERRYLEAGVAPERVVRVPPCVSEARTVTRGDRRTLRRELGWSGDRPRVLYAGDLEFGGGAELVMDALRALPEDVELVMACRPKTAAAREAEAALKERARALSLGERVRWLGETGRILDVIAAADVLALPSTNLYAKMDYPLVLLEAMLLRTPVLVAKGAPAAELAGLGVATASEARADAVAYDLGKRLETGAAEARAHAESVRERARSLFSPVAMARAYEAVYEGLIP